METVERQTGDKVDKTEWHRVVTFQDGLIDMFVKHAVKGRLVYIDGKLQTRRWSKPGEDGDRFSTEILLVPGGRVQFLDKPNGKRRPGAGRSGHGGRHRGRAGGNRRFGHPILNRPSSFRFLPPDWGRRIRAGPPFANGVESPRCDDPPVRLRRRRRREACLRRSLASGERE